MPKYKVRVCVNYAEVARQSDVFEVIEAADEDTACARAATLVADRLDRQGREHVSTRVEEDPEVVEP